MSPIYSYILSNAIWGTKSIAYVWVKTMVSCLWTRVVNPWAFIHNNNRKQLTGIATSTVSTGVNVWIWLNGYTDTNQSWMSAWYMQYVNEITGSKTWNSAGATIIWRALSATSLSVGFDYSNL
jgi:hypothetical protein